MRDLLIVKRLRQGHERWRELPVFVGKVLCRVELVADLGKCEVIFHFGLHYILVLARLVSVPAQVFPVLASIDREVETRAGEPVSIDGVLQPDRIFHVSAHETCQLLLDSFQPNNALQARRIKARHRLVRNLFRSCLLDPHPVNVARDVVVYYVSAVAPDLVGDEELFLGYLEQCVGAIIVDRLLLGFLTRAECARGHECFE